MQEGPPLILLRPQRLPPALASGPRSVLHALAAAMRVASPPAAAAFCPARVCSLPGLGHKMPQAERLPQTGLPMVREAGRRGSGVRRADFPRGCSAWLASGRLFTGSCFCAPPRSWLVRTQIGVQPTPQPLIDIIISLEGLPPSHLRC